MGYIKPFSIMLISLLSMQVATSNESLKCLILKSLICLEEFVLQTDQLCKNQKEIQCLKKVTEECNINDSTEASAMEQVRKLEQVFKDICQQDSEMNLAFLKHKDCLFGRKLTTKSTECNAIIITAISNYKMTGNTEKDEKEVYKIACKLREELKKCTSTNAKEICGEEADSFRRKLSDPLNNLEDIKCNNTSKTFMHFWTILLQATAILMSLQYFRLTK